LLFLTNNKIIRFLYLLFVGFSGFVGTSFSSVIRTELELLGIILIFNDYIISVFIFR